MSLVWCERAHRGHDFEEMNDIGETIFNIALTNGFNCSTLPTRSKKENRITIKSGNKRIQIVYFMIRKKI